MTNSTGLFNVPAAVVSGALQASTVQTVSGNSVTPVSGLAPADTLIFQTDVTAISGTGATITVVVQDTIDGTNWFPIATFTAITAVGSQVQRVTVPHTDQVRATWTIAGTTPSVTFDVQYYAESKLK